MTAQQVRVCGPFSPVHSSLETLTVFMGLSKRKGVRKARDVSWGSSVEAPQQVAELLSSVTFR